MAVTPSTIASAGPAPVTLDGATLTPKEISLIAREGAEARLSDEARGRNDAARNAVTALLARGDELYGVTTGVGALRAYRVPFDSRADYSLGLLRSHACGAGRPLPATIVRAAMATRANQIGAGGAGIADELLDALVGALNAGLSPFTGHRRSHQPRRHRACAPWGGAGVAGRRAGRRRRSAG
jgi:histidine ammonia-lyase